MQRAAVSLTAAQWHLRLSEGREKSLVFFVINEAFYPNQFPTKFIKRLEYDEQRATDVPPVCFLCLLLCLGLQHQQVTQDGGHESELAVILLSNQRVDEMRPFKQVV